MSKNTVSEATVVGTADAIAEAPVDSGGSGVSKVQPKVVKAKTAKSRNAAKTLKALAAERAIDPKDGRRRPKTRGSAASKPAGSTRRGSATGSGTRTPKEGGGKAPSARATPRKAPAKGVTARKRPGPAPRPLKAGEPPTPMAKPMGSPKAAANAGPAVEIALGTFDGSRALLAKFLGIQSQNLGRILRSHRAGWAERIPDQFVARLSAVSGMSPAEINPFVFLPNWKVPKMSKKDALAYATGEKPLPWGDNAE